MVEVPLVHVHQYAKGALPKRTPLPSTARNLTGIYVTKVGNLISNRHYYIYKYLTLIKFCNIYVIND